MPRLKITDLPRFYQEQAGAQLHGVDAFMACVAMTKTPDPQFPGCPAPLTEYKFHPTRKWRFDYAWPIQKVALEVDGGVWSGGRHTRGSGWIKDTDKLNEAAAHGWRMLRCTPQQLKKGEILPVLKRALGITTEL